MAFLLPDRRGDMTGSEFAGTIMNLGPGAARELAIFQQFELGNIPDFMRTPKRLRIADDKHVIEMDVLPDVLCVGTDDDFLRVPMTPATLQKIANLFDATLITPFLSDQIWVQADVRIDPMTVTMPPTHEMRSTKWFVDQNAKIEKQRAGRTGGIAGHKKDIVICNTLALKEFHDRVGIYGWHQVSGKPIQGMNPSPGIPLKRTHDAKYDDYSHGGRLGDGEVLVDGSLRDFEEVAQHPKLAHLLNGTYGPLTYFRYPTS